MNVLIVGGAGFVGGYLSEYLTNEGNRVFITKMAGDNFNTKGVDAIDMNLLNIEEIEDAFIKSSPDVIFNLAAQSSVAASWKHPQLTVDINIKGVINLLEVIKKTNIKPKIVLIGSGEEYGIINENDLPVNENKQLVPINVYAATKACQENMGRIYANAYDMDIVMTRSFNHFGPRQSADFVVAAFCKQIAEIEKGLNEPVINVGNLSAKRDFLDVRDVVVAYSLLMKSGKKGEAYNVGSGKAVEIKKILDEILKLTNMDIKINIDKEKFRPIDVPVIEADVAKLKRHTGWAAKIPLASTVEDTLNYWRGVV